MGNKKLVWIIIILVVIVISVGIFLLLEKEKVKPSPLSEQCAFACNTNQKAAFCDVKRKVNNNLALTCNELLTNSAYSTYGVQACPTISCIAQPQGNSQLASDQTCVGLEGTWETPTPDGKCPTKEGFYARKRTASDNPPIAGQICCYYY